LRLRAAVQQADGRHRIKEGYCAATGRPIYNLRHTAICMRLVLSEGKVNIFTTYFQNLDPIKIEKLSRGGPEVGSFYSRVGHNFRAASLTSVKVR
jgi:hypothetical protein